MTESAYVPGVWKCPKCDFRLIQSNLNALDGTVTARDQPGDKCPNCSSPLWRVSWKDEAQENMRIAENQLNRALKAEAEVERLRRIVCLYGNRARMSNAADPVLQQSIDDAFAQAQNQ